ncbi:VCBS domain-containing protein [Algibacillus agarilyticus]|uniref:VCBS domain-containing protein n=1 Tax=Algibacillus agarilyticus TaxID=2234133 RepID=UPI0018E58440|nr:VCBS domain-containing protein [Algibacillus agarilyticus]
MKKQFLTLSIIAALTACGSDDEQTIVAESPAEFSGDFSGTATKAASSMGTVKVNDVNPGESLVYPATTIGQFGTFSVNAAGEWEYVIDNANENVVALVSSDMPSLIENPFTVKAFDGTTTSVALKIAGIDVPAKFSGALTYSVFYDDGTATSAIKVTDANPAEALFAADQTPTAMYGSVSFDSGKGEWTYDLDETNTDVMALNYTEETDTPPSLEDTFIIKSADGTEGTVTITVKGSQLVPAVIEGLPIDEAGEATAMVNVNSVDADGELTITDVNFDQAKFQTQDAVATSYGTFSIDEAGAWTYKLDATNAEVVALKGDGEAPTPLMESIKVMSVDGTAVDIPITVNGLVGGNLTAKVDGGAADGIFRIDLPADAHESGKMTLKFNYEASGTKDAKIIFYGRSVNTDDKRTMAAITLRSNGQIKLMNGSGTKATFTLDQAHTPGDWHDLAFTWNAATDAKVGGFPVISLSINGTPVTSAGGEISGEVFPSFSIASFIVGIGSKLMQVSTKGGSGGGVYVDDYVIYSDVAGTNAIYTQNFDDLAEGAALELDVNNSATKATMVSPLAKP